MRQADRRSQPTPTKRRTTSPRVTVEIVEPLPRSPAYRDAPSAHDARGELTVRSGWWGRRGLVLLPVVVFALGMSGFFSWLSVSSLEIDPDSFALLAFLSCVYLLAGGGLIYWILGQAFNRTTVRVADGVLSVRHGPLPWLTRTDQDLDTDSIVAVQDVRFVSSFRQGLSYRFRVVVEYEDRSVEIVSDSLERDIARDVASALAEHLDVPLRRVRDTIER